MLAKFTTDAHIAAAAQGDYPELKFFGLPGLTRPMTNVVGAQRDVIRFVIEVAGIDSVDAKYMVEAVA